MKLDTNRSLSLTRTQPYSPVAAVLTILLGVVIPDELATFAHINSSCNSFIDLLSESEIYFITSAQVDEIDGQNI